MRSNLALALLDGDRSGWIRSILPLECWRGTDLDAYNKHIALAMLDRDRAGWACLQMGSMQLQMGASAAVEAMMADSRGCASRIVCSACRAATRCSRCFSSSCARSLLFSVSPAPGMHSDYLVLSNDCSTCLCNCQRPQRSAGHAELQRDAFIGFEAPVPNPGCPHAAVQQACTLCTRGEI